MKMLIFLISRFSAHRVFYYLLMLPVGVSLSVLQVSAGIAVADSTDATPFRFQHPDRGQQIDDLGQAPLEGDRLFTPSENISSGSTPFQPVIAEPARAEQGHPDVGLPVGSGAIASDQQPFQMAQTQVAPSAQSAIAATGSSGGREVLPSSSFSPSDAYDPAAPFTFRPPAQAAASPQPVYFTPAPAPAFDPTANLGSYQPSIAPLADTIPNGFSQVPPQQPVPGLSDQPAPLMDSQPLINGTAVTPSSIRLQGVYVLQGDESSARARVSAIYPLTPQILFGGTLDLTSGNAFSDSPEDGLSINELYIATAPRDLPNLRFVLGQLDLTSYFDRNSFAKDGASQFFNPVFQTNPALTAAAIGSRPGALVNWSVTDDVEARAAVFSSARSIGDFALDGFAGEVGFRVGNAILRGTYATAREAGVGSGFREVFQVDRGNGLTGPQVGDRQEAYGVNAEIFVPALNMGIFGRYGRYENLDLGLGGDTYSGGISFFDVFNTDDRLGVAYGRRLSNDQLRRAANDNVPDVLEVFYDFPLLSNLRLGLTYQQLNEFSESIAGLRLRTEFDVTPRGLQQP